VGPETEEETASPDMVENVGPGPSAVEKSMLPGKVGERVGTHTFGERALPGIVEEKACPGKGG